MIKYKDFSYKLDGFWPDIYRLFGIEIPEIKNSNSKNIPCPLCGGEDRAHWRDNNGRISLFCRGCASEKMKSPEEVIMEYACIDFSELTKILSDFIDHKPISVIKKVNKKSKNKNNLKINLPISDKRNPELSEKFISECKYKYEGNIDKYIKQNLIGYPIITEGGELINIAIKEKDKPIKFVAGGVSFGGFTPIKINDSDNWLACTSMQDAKFLAYSFNFNVAICWKDSNIESVIKSAETLKIKPVLTPYDDDKLLYEYDCGWLENFIFTKKKRI